jgi:hypothetical protein
MKLNYKVFWFLSVIVLLQNSYAQIAKKPETMSTEYITKVKNIYKEVKKYDYNPIYQIRYTKFNCPIEFYINDVLVIYLSGSGKSAGEQHIETTVHT